MIEILVAYFVFLIAIALACAFGAKSIMEGKGRSGAAGFWLGLLMGLLGVLIAALLSPTPEHEFKRQQQLMSLMAAQGSYPPAGRQAGQWAADPYGRHQLRYHDGLRWTDNVSNGGVQGDDPAGPRPAAVVATPGQWAADPYQRHQLRYFDGGRWTASVSNNGVTGIDAPG